MVCESFLRIFHGFFKVLQVFPCNRIVFSWAMCVCCVVLGKEVMFENLVQVKQILGWQS